jgi:hypothetical protein
LKGARSRYSTRPSILFLSALNQPLKLTTIIALAAAWVGYFSPWVWPIPAALRLSAHDLVEWLTFMQTVRDGTFPISRLDLLWPLASIAIITALFPSIFVPQTNYARQLTRPASIACLLLALFDAFLILPTYPFILTAYNDPELAPQFWLGVVTGIVASALYLITPRLPSMIPYSLMAIVALLCLILCLRLPGIITPPIVDMLTKPVELGYGFRLAIVGFCGLSLLPVLHLFFTHKKS